MSAKIIDGKAIAQEVRREWKARAQTLRARGVTPGLAVIIAGDNPASRVYVRHKTRACADVGIHSELHEFPVDAREEDVLPLIAALNAAAHIHGILVQLPLPPQFETRATIKGKLRWRAAQT